MMMNYRCVEIDAKPEDNAIEKIYEKIHEEDGYTNTRFQPHFIGFEADQGKSFKLNGIKNQVPSCGYFITPYDGEKFMTINSLYFDEEVSSFKIWCIY